MSEWCQITLAIFGGLITVFTLWNLIEQRVKSVKAPTTNLEERVAAIERKLEFDIHATFVEYEQRFKNDKLRLESIEAGNKVTQKAILALLEHSIDGNNLKEMQDARTDLKNYIFNK